VVATAFAFAILFELVYVVAMSLLGEEFAIGPDSIRFGLVAFVGYLVVVALVRNSGTNADPTDQP
jgi:hypothetical protein